MKKCNYSTIRSHIVNLVTWMWKAEWVKTVRLIADVSVLRDDMEWIFQLNVKTWIPIRNRGQVKGATRMGAFTSIKSLPPEAEFMDITSKTKQFKTMNKRKKQNKECLSTFLRTSYSFHQVTQSNVALYWSETENSRNIVWLSLEKKKSSLLVFHCNVLYVFMFFIVEVYHVVLLST